MHVSAETAEWATGKVELDGPLAPHAQRIYLPGETEEDREERELVAWIKRKGGRATVRDITRGLRRFRGDAAAVEKALARLVKKGLGRWVPGDHGGGPGRPASMFELIPSGDGDENAGFPGKTPIVSPSPEKNTGNGRCPPDDPEAINRLLAEAADPDGEIL